MSSFEKKEQNLNQLIDKLNSMSLSYSQPNFELEKIRTEKNEVVNQKKEIEDFDKAAEDLRLATRHLGMIVGKVDVEEILGSIFNDFCIGK